VLDEHLLLRDFGRRVGELREERRLTQREVAQRLRVGPRYYARIEAGERNLTLVSVARLARALGVKTSQLMERPRSRRKRRRGRPTSS
jgi:transcriptional regulator with XRE-family HTH domain